MYTHYTLNDLYEVIFHDITYVYYTCDKTDIRKCYTAEPVT